MLIANQQNQLTKSIEWAFDYDIYFFIEIPTSSIKPLLPHLVQPNEVRPGVSLLAYGLHRFESGNLDGSLPEFVEVNCSVVVQPRLSIGMPPPRFTAFVLYVAASTEGFNQHAANVDKAPIYSASNLQWTISPDGQQVKVWDDFGPMFTLQNTHPKPTYTTGDFNAQVFTSPNGENLYHTVVRWQGRLSENQHSGRGFGKVYNHPSLKGLEIDEKNQSCYMQMFTEQGAKGILTYARPNRVY